MRSSPLLIGGCPRSGTTALVELLNTNPSVFISSEENLLNTENSLRKLLGTRERRAEVYRTKGLRELSERETLSAEKILASNFTEEAAWPTIQFLYEWLHLKNHPSHTLKLWGDKLPNYYKHIDEVLAIPDVKYLHITRNPLDVINSMMRRTEMARQGKDWWKANTELKTMIEAWSEAYVVAEKIENHPHVLHLHYEDLVFNFSESIARVNRFLDLDLTFDNPLISDPAKHFDRAYLTDENLAGILADGNVKAYVERNKETPFLSMGLEQIEFPANGPDSHPEKAIRVFVAATPAEWLPMRVLEFSIRETTSHPVSVAGLYTFNRHIPSPQAIENKPRTPFSFQRFIIPELCNFSGKAIYLDADMQVFREINELWSVDFNDHALQTVASGNNGRRGQYSVMLLDCNKLDWNVEHIVANLDAATLNYSDLMYEMKVAKSIGHEVSTHWNSLEKFDPSQTCLLHYTDMNTQPWISIANPLGHLWIACLRRAIAAGFISFEELQREVQAEHVRPSLLAQVESGIDTTIGLPSAVKKLDHGFIAPYKRLRSGKARPWNSPYVGMTAFLRRLYYRSPIARFWER
jgi:hypothetical protein